MVVSLLKTLHSGLQDSRLQAPPESIQITPFYKVYIRAGRFTTEWVRIDFDNQPEFGVTARATLPRRGHLITRLYLVTTMPDIATPQQQAISTVNAATAAGSACGYAGPLFGWTNSLGHALVNQVSLEIGGTPIDRFDGRLLEVLDEFRTPFEKVGVTNRLLRRVDSGFNATTFGFSTPSEVVYTPLPFWFAQGDTAAALPIDAISQDKVTVTVQFQTLDTLYVSSDLGSTDGGISVVSSFNAKNRTFTGSSFINNPCAPPLVNTPLYFYSTMLSENCFDPPSFSTIYQLPGFQSPLAMGAAYILAEYVYLDKPEANSFRLADLTIPITQHYIQTPFDTQGATSARIPLRIPNPTRDIFFYAHRTEADRLNAPFLATRDLTAPYSPTLWWPDARGYPTNGNSFQGMLPAFVTSDSEPIASVQLTYEGKLVRWATDAPALFRSILPSFEQRKAPWFHRYFYNLPFGTQHGFYGPTMPMGEANLDKIRSVELQLTFAPNRGSLRACDLPSYTVYSWAETYNVLRIYGGRAGLMFAY